MLYEISLKYNTLKMYENTLEQMRKNGVAKEESILKIENERNEVEKELVELLNPLCKTINLNGYRNDPKIDVENKFIKEANKRGEHKKMYDIRNDFFENITKPSENDSPIKYRDESKDELKKAEYKKPTFADVQEKISNSQWISCSNFIVRFPKDEIDIDSWRVSGFYYKLKQNSKCLSNRSGCERGEISVIVNDFAEKREDGTYNILSKIIEKLYKYKIIVLGDIFVDVINNSGELLYTLCFTKCIFNGANPDAFSYESTDLRKFYLDFTYDNVHVLAPDEELKKDETTD